MILGFDATTLVGRMSGVGYYNSASRNRVPSTPAQQTYMLHLRCPFSPGGLDLYLARRIINQLEKQFPELADPDPDVFGEKLSIQ